MSYNNVRYRRILHSILGHLQTFPLFGPNHLLHPPPHRRAPSLPPSACFVRLLRAGLTHVCASPQVPSTFNPSSSRALALIGVQNVFFTTVGAGGMCHCSCYNFLPALAPAATTQKPLFSPPLPSILPAPSPPPQ